MRAAFFDVDGTLTRTRVWEGIMGYFKQRGEKRWVDALFWAVHMPPYLLYKIGLVPQSAFRGPWARHLGWYFKGYTVDEMDEAWDWVATEFMAEFWRADVRALLDEHRAQGDVIFLISAGPVPLLKCFAQVVGADHVVGTHHDVRDGRYTGHAGGANIDDAKRTNTLALIDELALDIDLRASFAYADSPGDRDLLAMVGNPVATYPDEDLLPYARAQGWQVFPEGYEGEA